MICPACAFENTKVVDSRTSAGGLSIRRRRECDKCKFRFTTFERLQSSNFVVSKESGTTEPYDRQKLERGILISCAKRPVDIGKIRENLNELEEKWAREPVVSTEKIGGDVMEMLRKTDEVAFIRFASVYKDFDDVDSFRDQLKEIDQ